MSNNKHQTAVDSVIEYFSQYVDMKKHVEEIKKFKEMEKEQIINAWMDGMEGILHKIAAEKYYEQTYGGNK